MGLFDDNRATIASVVGAAVIVLGAGRSAAQPADPIRIFPTRAVAAARQPAATQANPAPVGCGVTPGGLDYHGGPVMHKARHRSLWWGTDGFDVDIQKHVAKFFARFGRSGEYETITQYGDAEGLVQAAHLSGSRKVDPSPPPSIVSDLDVQAELRANFDNRRLGRPNESTLYYVFLPNGVTSTAYGMTSCVEYCAYHSYFDLDGMAIKYAVVPYPSCWGCQGYQLPDMSAAASSVTIFTAHETREAVTDPLLNAWWDSATGMEADDRCAWQLFVDPDDGMQYQLEWSLAANGCVQKGICGP
jgi:hypothetical protein